MRDNTPSTTGRGISGDGRAAAIEAAAEYVNVALDADGHKLHVELSDVFLPDLLAGIDDIEHVQLVPMGPPGARRLEFVFTTRQTPWVTPGEDYPDA